MNEFDPRSVSVTVNSTIITGFADGTFIKVEKNEDNFKTYVGAQGEVSRSISADKTGKITVTLQSTSPSYIYLNSLSTQNIDYPAYVSDLNTGITYGGTSCRIVKPAAVEISKEITAREFTLDVAELTYN